MKNESLVFSPTLFFQYAKSPHWIWFDHYGDQTKKGEIPAMTQRFIDEGVLHEENYVQQLKFDEVDEKDSDPFQTTLHLMKQGVERIYQGHLEVEKDGVLFKGIPDFLEKQPGRSKFGDYYYLPVDIKNTSTKDGEDAKIQYRLQLAMYVWMLKEIQEFPPEKAYLINRDFERVEVETGSDLSVRMWHMAEKILFILKGEEPPLKIGTACKDSPWFDWLLTEAKTKNDIALLYNLHENSLADMRQKGLRTLEDFSRLNPDDLPEIVGLKEGGVMRAHLQAKSLLNKEVIWREPADIPDGKLRIYFDIEGDPFLKIDYLYGFWVVGDGDKEPYFKYFLAEKPEDEEQMWSSFLEWVEGIHTRDYKVYHYSPYERSSLRKMTNRYGGSEALDVFSEHFVDLAKVVKRSVIFPLYFYSIKDIAKSDFLKYKWRHPEASGAQSIFWYEQWLETGDRKVLQNIVDYNEDDVIATEVLHKWLKANSPQTEADSH